MYDIAIIGSGPAGISAAINLKILNKNFIWFSSRAISKKVEKAELIKNYPGLPDITGEELAKKLYNHAKNLGIEPCEELVTGVYQAKDKFTLIVKDKDYEAKAVILCVGVESAKQISGEENFVGRGVSYCATCDGFLYKGKTIGILCTDKKFEHEVEYLAEIAKKAYVMPMYKGYEIKSQNAEIVLKNPTNLTGDMRLKKIEFRDSELEVDGLFVLRGGVSPSTLVYGLKTEQGHILVDRNMATSIDGIFAAGDCVGRPYQYAKSIGEGNIAAHSAIDYISAK